MEKTCQPYSQSALIGGAAGRPVSTSSPSSLNTLSHLYKLNVHTIQSLSISISPTPLLLPWIFPLLITCTCCTVSPPMDLKLPTYSWSTLPCFAAPFQPSQPYADSSHLLALFFIESILHFILAWLHITYAPMCLM